MELSEGEKKLINIFVLNLSKWSNPDLNWITSKTRKCSKKLKKSKKSSSQCYKTVLEEI